MSPKLASVDAQLADLNRFARLCVDDFDHDEDAHRYLTPCRKCEAEKLLGRRPSR